MTGLLSAHTFQTRAKHWGLISLALCHTCHPFSNPHSNCVCFFVFFSRPIILSRWEAGSSLYNEGPGCPPDDAAPACVVLWQRQTQDTGPGQQTGGMLLHYDNVALRMNHRKYQKLVNLQMVWKTELLSLFNTGFMEMLLNERFNLSKCSITIRLIYFC